MQSLVKRKLFIVTVVTLLIAVVVTALIVMSFGSQQTSDTSKHTPEAIFRAANNILRESSVSSAPYDRPMQIKGDVKEYESGWFTATIVLLDEHPDSYEQEMIYVFHGNGDSVKPIAVQPVGWFSQDLFPENAPHALIDELIGDPHYGDQ